jgi:hypothetical protein
VVANKDLFYYLNLSLNKARVPAGLSSVWPHGFILPAAGR